MNDQSERKDFTFKIALSVLNHLGRNLYRSFVTVLGEAISNSWDADAEHVWLYIDRDNGNFFIKDDGIGMTVDEFQNKFLKIGYSKRIESHVSPGKKRPYIGRKGIGKLALLACADRITVISRIKGGDYVGGVIDNSDLDEAIKDDLAADEYRLGEWTRATFSKYTEDHEKGTIIYFENIKEGIKHRLEYLKKIIALYFRFSLLDEKFKIFINDEEITLECLSDLIANTQFWWIINDLDDPYVKKLDQKYIQGENIYDRLSVEGNITGYIASTVHPSHLKIFGTGGEKVGVDLFVNGRLRERNILKHIPSARIPESYLYGQIHFNDLEDKEKDRFASNREDIVAEDPKFKELLEILRTKVINRIIDVWDDWRGELREDGDPDNPRMTPKERKAVGLYNVVSKEYGLPKSSENKGKVDAWVTDLGFEARFNFPSYAECFISENLLRKYIEDKKISLSTEARRDINHYKGQETKHKNEGNVSIEIRKQCTDLSYLDMDGLANLVDKPKKPTKEAGLARDAQVYKPIRDGLAHTTLLTEQAKYLLTSVFANIKARIITLLAGKSRKPSGKK